MAGKKDKTKCKWSESRIMIIDNVIDEVTARYFCAANKRLIEDAVKNARKAARENSAEKLGIQTAIALGPSPEKKLEQAKT